MAIMRSSNPALRERMFEVGGAGHEAMTLASTANKCGVLLTILIVTAALTWHNLIAYNAIGLLMPWLLGCSVAAFVVALVTIFKRTWAGMLAPIYAALEGVVIGGVSLLFELQFPGIALQAVCLTVATFVCLLAAYKSGLIKATENFKLGVTAATGGIAVVYLIDIGMSMFGTGLGLVNGASWIGIGFSVLVVTVAALNLVMDFDLIETGVERGAPKYMEWYAAFGLVVTLVWLYLEMLRLLGKARR